MGMDVYGKSGNYFRNSVWSWRPLADYIQHVSPECWSENECWHTNDGGGLNAEYSRKLANRLRECLASGHTSLYESNFKRRNDSLPKLHCNYCNGTGIRTDKVGVDLGFPQMLVPSDANHHRAGQRGYCNACQGEGLQEDILTYYRFSAENVEEFAVFLEDCDGFEIW